MVAEIACSNWVERLSSEDDDHECQTQGRRVPAAVDTALSSTTIIERHRRPFISSEFQIQNSKSKENLISIARMTEISTLSDDVLYLVFLHTLPSEIVAVDGKVTARNAISPLSLSAVCRSWHRVVVSRSTLWSSISVVHFRSSCRPKHDVPVLFTRWLRRTEPTQLLLDIQLLVEIKSEDDCGSTCITHLLDAVSHHLHRLRFIKIDLRDWSTSSRSRRPMPFKCSSATTSITLEHEIKSRFRLAPPVLLDLASSVDHARLRTLSITSGVLWRAGLPSHEQAALAFPVLSELKICIDPSYELLHVHALLSVCPNIEILDVREDVRECFSGYKYLDMTATNVLSFSRLRSLGLSFGKLDLLTHILEWFTCPSLTALRLHIVERIPTPAMFNTFLSFFSHSGDRLETLTFTASCNDFPVIALHDSYARALEDMLRALRDLVELDLEGGFVVIDARLIEAMTLSTPGAAICPRLTKLRLVCLCTGPSDALSKVMETMITSRWKPSRRLKAVELRIPGVMDVEKKGEALQACIEEGLVFR